MRGTPSARVFRISSKSDILTPDSGLRTPDLFRCVPVLCAIVLMNVAGLFAGVPPNKEYYSQVLKLSAADRFDDIILLAKARIAQEPADCAAYRDLIQAA